MKLKYVPEDFIVREKVSYNFVDRGPWACYLLQKRDLNTLDVLKDLSRTVGVPMSKIGFAGTKDKHAVTEQYISVPQHCKLPERLGMAYFEFKGYLRDRINLGDHDMNTFEIIIRKSHEPTARSWIVNYFGEQRFGAQNAKLGKLLVKKKYKEFCESYGLPLDNPIEQVKKVPRRLLLLFIHSYQSFAWNEVVASKMDGREEEYSMGVYRFALNKTDGALDLPGFLSKPSDVSEWMEQDGVKLSDFINRSIPGLSVEGDLRNICVAVDNCTVKKIKDEYFGGTAYRVTFGLPKGSYATQVIRQML